MTTAVPDHNGMARVLREMTCPNTAFSEPRKDDDGYNLRWFTGAGSRSHDVAMQFSGLAQG